MSGCQNRSSPWLAWSAPSNRFSPPKIISSTSASVAADSAGSCGSVSTPPSGPRTTTSRPAPAGSIGRPAWRSSAGRSTSHRISTTSPPATRQNSPNRNRTSLPVGGMLSHSSANVATSSPVAATHVAPSNSPPTTTHGSRRRSGIAACHGPATSPHCPDRSGWNPCHSAPGGYPMRHASRTRRFAWPGVTRAARWRVPPPPPARRAWRT